MAMVISSGVQAPCSLLMATLMLLIVQAQSFTRHYNFNVQMANVTRLCATKSIVTVNGEYPGPALVAREGGRVVVRVTNHVARAQHDAALARRPAAAKRLGHRRLWRRHRRLSSSMASTSPSPGSVARCGGTRTFRATVYGVIVVLPKHGVPYPFAAPHMEVPVIFGEWWRADTEAVLSQALQTGGPPNVSDGFTINGLPGPLYNCSAKGTCFVVG
ncbi:hypothetical protein CFC21_054350 [Triticum aestivum]|uniref:Plastocyanin-like domain-containing protein n=2 Tax=Triticum aestivum TaxID=4565 RepID=A0A3B6HZR1_WHEAT|nr:hypothetical protein CFC21_054350 [Triticum aestivum]